MPHSRGTEPSGGGLDALVEAARHGDAGAYEQLWRELSPAVLGYLRGRGTPEAEDVVSEVFLAVFRGLPGFVGGGSALRSWVFTIAHHRAVDAIRRAQRAAVPVQDVELSARASQPGLPASAPVPAARSAEDEVLAQLGDPALAAALAQLPAAQREVLLMRTVGELSLEEVAQATGRSVGAVKSLQHRAVAAVQRNLAAAVSPDPAETMAPPR